MLLSITCESPWQKRCAAKFVDFRFTCKACKLYTHVYVTQNSVAVIATNVSKLQGAYHTTYPTIRTKESIPVVCHHVPWIPLSETRYP